MPSQGMRFGLHRCRKLLPFPTLAGVPTENAACGNGKKSWLSIFFAAGVRRRDCVNFMPCVFPILFIKIMSIAGRKSKRRNVTEAFQYLGGVLSCFLLMAALLAWLRHRGADIGWGFQLQSPYFVAVMAVVFLLLALMFLNVIRVNWSLRYLPAGSFMTGFLAVLIASPCTAPFMGGCRRLGADDRTAGLFLLSGVFVSWCRVCVAVFFLAGIYPRFCKEFYRVPANGWKC